MSTGATVGIVIAALVVIALLAALVLRNGAMGSMGEGVRLKRRFGPEYERTLAQHDGDEKATREELAERVRQHGGIEHKPLAAQSRERYGNAWTAVQAKFVDEPGQAVADADQLVGGLAAERGFPAANASEHFDALSVHHPHHVHGYRQAHALAGCGGAAEQSAKQSTEELRKALLGVRGLFDDLLRDDGKGELEPANSQDSADEVATDEDQDERSPRTSRLSSLTGGRRSESESDEHL